MKDILNQTKGKINIHIIRTLINICSVIIGVLIFKKKTNKKKKVLAVLLTVSCIFSLAIEAEKSFKPIDYDEEEEQ